MSQLRRGQVIGVAISPGAHAKATILKNVRQMNAAVQALYAIGSEHVGEKRYEEAMSRLYTLAEEEPSEKVRDAVADAIDRSQTG